MDKLKRYRSFAGLLQSDMADRLGIGVTTYCSYENGVLPRVDIALRIVDIINRNLPGDQETTIEELFQYETTERHSTDGEDKTDSDR